MLRISRNVKTNFTARARSLLGPAGWLVIWVDEEENRSSQKQKASPAPQREGAAQLAAVPASEATLGYPSSTREKHMEMTATAADPGGSQPHQFSLELKGTSQ